MRRYTTPTLTLRIDGEGLAGCDVYVTLTQGETEITVTGEECTSVDVDDSGMTVRLQLTQEQTARFEPRKAVRVQANIVDSTGHRFATDIQRVSVWDNLLAEVIQ